MQFITAVALSFAVACNAWSQSSLPRKAHIPQRRITARHSQLQLQAQSQITTPASKLKPSGIDETERSPLLEKLENLEGIWYSDDFYGSHGREWVEVSATLLGSGTRALRAVKASGDDNVPAGFETWRTRGLPDVGGSDVPAEIQVRADVNDPDGFSWIRGSLSQTTVDKIQVTAIYSAIMRHTGTFYKHKVDEGDA